MLYKVLLIIVIAILLNPYSAIANENEFISIVNPIRISDYSNDPVASIKAQYFEIRSRKLPATWLLTYDVVSNNDVVNVIRDFNSDQEIGIFLEVTPKLASDVDVVYRNLGSWHFAGSVFLSGYSQSERIKIIDKVFSSFKKEFGYYPTSVGSWWTDSYSLKYLSENYGVTASLGCADQFSTDGYQIWGTFWSAPYYPSRNHSGIPAQSEESKLDVVMTQWAPREPYNGYFDSRYSTQDYFTSPGKNIDYFEDLVSLYASSKNNQFGQVTIGLEGDFSPETYSKEFSAHLDVARKLNIKDDVNIVSMKTFSEWYRNKFPDYSPSHQTISELNWFNSVKYRVGYDNSPPKIYDIRVYSDKVVEPYYTAPNYDRMLKINIESIIDGVSSSNEIWSLPDGTLIAPEDDSIVIYPENNIEVPAQLVNHPGVIITRENNALKIIFSENKLGNGNGSVFRDWSIESKYFFSQLKFPLDLLRGVGWNYFSKQNYLVTHDEIVALHKLSIMDDGIVLTPDIDCLQCKWSGAYKYPSISNSRSYISKLTGKKVKKSKKVFGAQSREESLKEFIKTKAKYVYLVNHEDYVEKLPFSPGDLGVELVYSNANAQIWKVK